MSRPRSVLMGPWLLVAVAFMVTAASAQDDKKVERRHDVRVLVAPRPVARSVSLYLPVSFGRYGELAGEDITGLPQLVPGLDADRLHALVLEAMLYSPEGSVEVEHSYVEAGYFSALATADTHRRIEGFLAELETWWLQSVGVEVHVLDAEASRAVTDAVLDAAEVDRILALEPTLGTMRQSLPYDISTRLQAIRRRTAVTEHDVEVGAEVGVADPLVTTILEGRETSVTVSRGPQNRVLASVALRTSTLLSMGESPSVPNVGTVQVPTCGVTAAAATGLIENGGALVVGSAGEGTMILHRFRFAWKTPDWIVATASLTRPVAPVPFPPPLTATSSGMDRMPIYGSDHPDEKPVEVEPLLTAGAILSRPDVHEEECVALLGADLSVRGEDAEITRPIARQQVADLARTVSLEFRLGVLASSDGKLLLGEDLAPLVAHLPDRGVTSVGAGHAGMVIRGTETHYLMDLDIEFSGKVAIADPVMAYLFSGWAVRFEALPIGGERVSLVWDFQHSEVFGREEFETGHPVIGSIERVKTRGTVAGSTTTITRGPWTLLHGAARPDGKIVALAVRALR